MGKVPSESWSLSWVSPVLGARLSWNGNRPVDVLGTRELDMWGRESFARGPTSAAGYIR